MSLDVWLTAVRPVTVFEENITHNLNNMANEVHLSNGKTLYDIMWCPDKHGYTKASEIAPLLLEAYTKLLADRDRLMKFNPSDGWDYGDLVQFIRAYLKSCTENPDGIIGVCR